LRALPRTVAGVDGPIWYLWRQADGRGAKTPLECLRLDSAGQVQIPVPERPGSWGLPAVKLPRFTDLQERGQVLHLPRIEPETGALVCLLDGQEIGRSVVGFGFYRPEHADDVDWLVDLADERRVCFADWLASDWRLEDPAVCADEVEFLPARLVDGFSFATPGPLSRPSALAA
jgi:hypothetical protein